MSGDESLVDRVRRSPPGARVLVEAEPRITVPGPPLTSTVTIVSRWFGLARKPKYEYRPPREAVTVLAGLIRPRRDIAPPPRASPLATPPPPNTPARPPPEPPPHSPH